MDKEEEYKELFLAEAIESHESLNKLFTDLEKDSGNKNIINNIFRITHTLKGNAMGLGLSQIAELSHVLEDVFNEIKSGTVSIDPALFDMLYKAIDKLGELIQALRSNQKVNYKGIKTKLEVYLKGVKQDVGSNNNSNPEIATIVSAVNEKKSFDNVEETIISETDDEESDNGFKVTLNDVVQVPVRKLDSLLNIVGELIIEKDSLVSKFQELIGSRGNEFAMLHRIASDLQYGVMDIRLIQVGFLFNKFHRIVRDVANIENKKVNLVLEGTEIEIDRNVIKVMSDSLVHLIRNAVSHGIETPEQRLKAGKPEIGTLRLKARNEKDTVFIEVSDDGGGIDGKRIKQKAIEKGMLKPEHAALMTDEDAINFIFEPGFSNADEITEVSGRGVGMDVVRRATDSIGGKIDVITQVGKGTNFILSLPSSMAVKGALLFELDKQEFAIPLSYTDAVVSLRKNDFHRVNNGYVATYLEKTISIIFLKDLFEYRENEKQALYSDRVEQMNETGKAEVIIVSYAGKLAGFAVDKLLQQKEIVEKTLSDPLEKLEYLSGATILGNGNVCLVIDPSSILKKLFKEKLSLHNA
jgi:two-component system chemotaxis sensor kinase CheA